MLDAAEESGLICGKHMWRGKLCQRTKDEKSQFILNFNLYLHGEAEKNQTLHY